MWLGKLIKASEAGRTRRVENSFILRSTQPQNLKDFCFVRHVYTNIVEDGDGGRRMLFLE